jgi:hypothetical protein
LINKTISTYNIKPLVAMPAEAKISTRTIENEPTV